MKKYFGLGLLSLLLLSALLSIGASGCPWTSRDPDLASGSSSQTKTTTAEILPTNGSSEPITSTLKTK